MAETRCTQQTPRCSVEGCERSVLAKRLCSKHYERLRTTGTTDARRAEPRESLRFLEALIGHAGNDCVKFPFVRDRHGYGLIHRWRGRRSINASRVMCILHHGEPPFERAEAAHSCGNGHKGCVNPNHLRWATRQENINDAVMGGKMHRAARRTAKITEQQAVAIRTDPRRQIEIAAQYGIHQSIVSQIKSGKRWRVLLEA